MHFLLACVGQQQRDWGTEVWSITMAQMIKKIVSDKWWIISCHLGVDSICKSIPNVPHRQDRLALQSSPHVSAEQGSCKRAAEIKHLNRVLNCFVSVEMQVTFRLCVPPWPQCNLHKVGLVIQWSNSAAVHSVQLSHAKLLVILPLALC